MRPVVVSLAAFATLAGAQTAKYFAGEEQPAEIVEPFAPSPDAAPLMSLGYRELAADLLFFRLVGYVGGRDYTGDGVASLVEAVHAMDPHHKKIYEWGALAMMMSARKDQKTDNAIFLRAIKLLDDAQREFPTEYKYAELAGQCYLVDLHTTDPAQRRAWDEAGAAHLNRAIRMPGAPSNLATMVAHIYTKLGKQERAKQELREMLLITDDTDARASLLAKLAELENADSADVAAEVFEERNKFDRQWHRDRPYVPASLYILIGPRPAPGFDLGDLATGGRDLVGDDFVKPVE
jgi:tetratricopeptide (TPR) repeat protein